MLEHVNLTVSELDRSLQFYREAFGFEVRWQGKCLINAEVKPAAHVGVPGEPFYLALFEGDAAGPAQRDYAPPGINHFGFRVEDLDLAKQRAEAAGAKVHLEFEYEPGRRFYVTDPDGIEIEVVTY
jgi:catechol 2,3-dioxygenase-like lactoylglutathione lyase family enzyme